VIMEALFICFVCVVHFSVIGIEYFPVISAKMFFISMETITFR